MQLAPALFVLATALLSTVSLAAPNPAAGEQEVALTRKRDALLRPGTRVVDFGRVRSHLDHLKAKYSDNLRAFHHNTGKAHPWQVADVVAGVTPAGKRATGSVPLIDVDGEQLWTGQLSYGGRSIYVDFDTGSADVIVNHNAYSPGSSARNTGRTFSTSYGDGTTASGPVYTDSFSIAGLSANNVGLGWASNQFLTTAEAPNAGIAGMSYPSLNTLGTAPFFDALRSAGAVSKGVFTFTLNPSSARLYLGGVDPSAGTPTYVNVDSSRGFWGTTGSINGRSTAGIQDTGTTIIVAPVSYARSLFRSLRGVQTFYQGGAYYGAYNCNAPPSITIKFGAFSKALSSATESFGMTNDGRCVLSIVGENIGLNAVIFGDSWLQNVHAVFDRDNNRVGFSSQ